jgi:hypothetical protein
LQEVGHVTWPLSIGNVADFTEGNSPRSPQAAANWPAHLAVFAMDGSGNCYGFDLRGRRGRELPIEFWDHEEPDTTEDEPGPPERFEDWLEARIEEDSERQVTERRAALADRLTAHHVDDAFTPERAQVTEVEGTLGVTLPADYVWFTSTFGALRSPVRVVDALSLPDLTAELRARRGDGTKKRLVAFAKEGVEGYAAFDAKGQVYGFGVTLPAKATFLDYIEDRLSRSDTPQPTEVPLTQATEDEELAWAERLLARLLESGQLETTRGFPAELVARRIADAWKRPARIVAMLIDRDDVNEVYVSEKELLAIQVELARDTKT